jgi:hypothetical protein
VDDNENNDGSNNIIFGNQIVEEPKVGMKFDSEEDVFFLISKRDIIKKRKAQTSTQEVYKKSN